MSGDTLTRIDQVLRLVESLTIPCSSVCIP